jgi:hypothetical protein
MDKYTSIRGNLFNNGKAISKTKLEFYSSNQPHLGYTFSFCTLTPSEVKR